MSPSIPLLLIGCVLPSLAACGPSSASTPEAALRVLLEAAQNGDASGFRAGFPSKEEVAELFECPTGVDLGARFEGLSDEFVAWRNARPVLASGGLEVAVHTLVEAGEEVGGCKSRRQMSLMRANVRLTEGGAERVYAMRFVELDGRFRVLGF